MGLVLHYNHYKINTLPLNGLLLLCSKEDKGITAELDQVHPKQMLGRTIDIESIFNT